MMTPIFNGGLLWSMELLWIYCHMIWSPWIPMLFKYAFKILADFFNEVRLIQVHIWNTGVPKLNRPELETACEDFSNIIDTFDGCIVYKGTLSSGVEIAVASTLIKTSKEWTKNSEIAYRKKVSFFCGHWNTQDQQLIHCALISHALFFLSSQCIDVSCFWSSVDWYIVTVES